jgi:hypothetical protein
MMGSAWREEIEEALSDPEVPEGVRQLIEMFLEGGIGLGAIFLGLFLSLVIFSIFGAIGGIIGIAIFQKKVPPSYPTQSYQAPTPPPKPTTSPPSSPPPQETPPAPQGGKPDTETGGGTS